MANGQLITWNGVEAYWEPEDLELGRRLREQMEAGEITPDEAKQQVDVIHELKVLGAVQVKPVEEASRVIPVQPPLLVEQNSETFRIPDKAVNQLEAGARDTSPTRSGPSSWPPPPLPDPGKNTIGAFHAPASGAPATERQATIMQYPKSGTDRLAVLDALAGSGSDGLTDDEGAELTGLYRYTYAPRRKELVDDGWVEDAGSTRTTDRGKEATVWRLTTAGREQWKPS